MHRFLFLLIVLFAFTDTSRQGDFRYEIVLEDAPSEIFGNENLMDRLEYERLIVSDPATGQLPENIRARELFFAQKINTHRKGRLESELTYRSLGPVNVGGRTRAVAFDVRDSSVILAGGVSGGIWKSTDGGQTWIRKSSPANRNSVTCIAQDIRAGHEDTWYHGTGEFIGNSARGGGAPFRGDGIYKSTDNGETWVALVSTQDSDPNVFSSQFQYIFDITTNPTNLSQEEVLVAAFGGILRSVDGGQSWEAVQGKQLFDLGEDANLNESIASAYTSIHRTKSNIFYATLSTENTGEGISPDAGIFYSTDGMSWNDITPSLPFLGYQRIVIGSSASNPDIVYFLAQGDSAIILKHDLSKLSQNLGFQPPIYRVVPDLDDNLGKMDTQGSYNMVIRVHPENENTVYAGGTNLFRSTDGFVTREGVTWIGGYTPEGGSGVYENHHPDQHALLFWPETPDQALSANDGGLFYTSDITKDTVVWESRNDGYITSQFYTIAQSKQAGNATLLGGMQDNGTDLALGGSQNWAGLLGGDGGYVATTRDERLWFASFQRGQTLRLTYDESFDLTSFRRVDPGGLVRSAGSQYLFVNPFVTDPANPNRMFCAGGNHLYFHPNISQIPSGSQEPASIGWQRVTQQSIESGLVSATDISQDSEVVYFGTSGGDLYRLDGANDNRSFQLKQLDRITSGYISSISIHPDNSNHLLVVISSYNVRSVFESKDGGTTFLDISGNLEENADGTGSGPSVRWGEIVPTNSGYTYFLGTSTGLYMTASPQGAGTEWIKQSENFIGNAVIPMMDYRASDGRLVIASHGNGVFETFVADFLPIESVEPKGPEDFILGGAFPNPAQDRVTINYELPEDGVVKISILSLKGDLIKNILWGPQYAGANHVVWDGTNATGAPLANGVYIYRLAYNNEQSQSGKLILRR